ncbi:hypothetical protein V5799_011999 [Amblyomma americanum]|uniref:Uncharacterized protein n=1 Tax=Amblyomma americanum TaxID=6943 RepID=A0AAQ4EFH4_AMBAM
MTPFRTPDTPGNSRYNAASARHYEGSGGMDHRAAEKKIPLPACRAADGSRLMPCHHCGVLCAAQCGEKVCMPL